MLSALVLAASLLLPGAAEGGPIVRVDAGEARLVDGREPRVLDRRSGASALAATKGWVEAGALAEVELAWRGLASARVYGPASFQIAREPGLVLEHAQVLELEVRRGTLALALTGAGSLEVGAGALRVRSLPDGVVELFNRGGGALELRRVGEKSLRIGAGERLRLRVRQDRGGN